MSPDDILAMRAGREAYDRIRRDENLTSYPIATWGAYTYIVLDGPALREGLQRLRVLDISDARPRAAGFQRSWPEQPHLGRPYALVIVPDEGPYYLVLQEDGRYLQRRDADLAVRLVPGDQADWRDVRRQQLEDAEAAVDAGGALLP